MAANTASVTVGASLAGAKVAQTLREEGFDDPIVLLGEESECPYERPPLSKGYLMGKVYVHPAEWYAEHNADLRLGVTVTSIDRGSRPGTGRELPPAGSRRRGKSSR